MGMYLQEAYKLPEDPDTWGAFITNAIKDFFAKYGKMPTNISAKEVLMVLIECVLELEGFTRHKAAFRPEIIEKLKEMEGFEDMEEFQNLENISMVAMLPPDGSYRNMSGTEDDAKPLEFHLTYMTGEEQVVN